MNHQTAYTILQTLYGNSYNYAILILNRFFNYARQHYFQWHELTYIENTTCQTCFIREDINLKYFEII